MSELDDMRSFNFDDKGEGDSDSRARQRKRLSQDRQPRAAASSQSWVHWGLESDFLGQPFDSTRIPLVKLEQMRRDPILAFALMFVKVPLVRAPWYIKCADPKIAAAVDASLRKIYGRFILAYCNSLDYGFSPIIKRFEYDENPDWVYVDPDNPDGEPAQVWTQKTVKPLVWKPFTALDPRKCVPHWDAKGNFNGIDFNISAGIGAFGTSGHPWDLSGNLQGIGGQGRIADIPLDWALWATNEKDSVFGSYWGYPRIGYAYRFWWAYWYRFGVADRAFERWGDPPMYAYHPSDPLDLDDQGNPIDYTSIALGILEQARSGANIAMPSSVVTSLDEKPTGMREWEIGQIATKTDFSAIGDQFRYLDIQKLRSVMVPEQALVEGEGGTSSRNVASTFGELFQESMVIVKEEIDDHINRYVIPQFVSLNFGPDSPKAEIVTTGFEQLDMDNMRAVLQLVGQRKLLSVVDERELAERMGIPTVSRKEAQRRLEEAAKEAELMNAPSVEPQPKKAAGVDSATGLYYEGRDRIVLGERTTMPYMIERVDELPNGEEPAAYFDTETRTLFVKKDADPTKVTGYLLGLTQQMEKEDSKIPDDIGLVLEEFQRLSTKFDETSGKETKVHVDLHQPDPSDPTEFATVREVTERDDDGLIRRTKEWKEKVEREDDEGGSQ